MNSEHQARARDPESLVRESEQQSGLAPGSSHAAGDRPGVPRHRTAVPAEAAVEAYVDTTQEGLFRAVVVEPSGHVWVGPKRTRAQQAISDAKDRIRHLENERTIRRFSVDVSTPRPDRTTAEYRQLGR